jgi:polyketide synthase PksN
MSSDPRPSPQAALPTSGAGVLDAFTAVLAEMTGVDAGRIDPERTFQSLGLDSMLAVEFVSMVNSRHGTGIRASVLQDHPTPASLARYLAAELGVPGPPPAPPAAGEAPAEIVDTLRTRLAGILRCSPADITADAAFTLLGIDSILGAEFVESINRAYGLDERISVLYDRPDLTAMAAYIASRGRTAAAPGPRPAVAAVAPLTEGEVHALLDAVRDDLLSIDEAAALLAAHAA